MGDVSQRDASPKDEEQIGIVDPDCRMIGLHLYDGLFKVIPFDNNGQLKDAFNIRLEELRVLDMKFLYGCPKPTIVVLYRDNDDVRHVKTYEVALKDKDFVEGPWSRNNLDDGAALLIPVPPPLCGVLIIGAETIVYSSASTFKEIPIGYFTTRAYGRVNADGSCYLLGDWNGLLHLLVITHEQEQVTDLKIEQLGETSIASSISYLYNEVVFVGSIYGDSQLIKVNLQPDAKGSYVEVLERYVNLGPITDFCVVERQGQGQVVTCSGDYKDGSLRIVRNGNGISDQASVGLQIINDMCLDGIQKLHIRSIPLGEQAQCICHQKLTRTFAICSVKYNLAEGSEMNFVRLLDDQTFDCISTYPLDEFESGCSIVSCTFLDGGYLYLCVGTAYLEDAPIKGRILVFTTSDRALRLLAESGTDGGVHSLKAFNGFLLASFERSVVMYDWVRQDGIRQLQYRCNYLKGSAGLYSSLQTRGYSIVVGDFMRSIRLLNFRFNGSDGGWIREDACDYNMNGITAVEILNDDIYLGAERNFNLFTFRKNKARTCKERQRLQVVGEYHLGDIINRFQHGSLAMRLPDSDFGQIPTLIFGTDSGVIGVIASLSHLQYIFLEELQTNLRKVIKGVGGLSHEEWRSFNNEVNAKNFLDGDLIESFLHLSRNKMVEISEAMGVHVGVLTKTVEKLARLH